MVLDALADHETDSSIAADDRDVSLIAQNMAGDPIRIDFPRDLEPRKNFDTFTVADLCRFAAHALTKHCPRHSRVPYSGLEIKVLALHGVPEPPAKKPNTSESSDDGCLAKSAKSPERMHGMSHRLRGRRDGLEAERRWQDDIERWTSWQHSTKVSDNAESDLEGSEPENSFLDPDEKLTTYISIADMQRTTFSVLVVESPQRDIARCRAFWNADDEDSLPHFETWAWLFPTHQKPLQSDIENPKAQTALVLLNKDGPEVLMKRVEKTWDGEIPGGRDTAYKFWSYLLTQTGEDTESSLPAEYRRMITRIGANVLEEKGADYFRDVEVGPGTAFVHPYLEGADVTEVRLRLYERVFSYPLHKAVFFGNAELVDLYLGMFKSDIDEHAKRIARMRAENVAPDLLANAEIELQAARQKMFEFLEQDASEDGSGIFALGLAFQCGFSGENQPLFQLVPQQGTARWVIAKKLLIAFGNGGPGRRRRVQHILQCRAVDAVSGLAAAELHTPESIAAHGEEALRQRLCVPCCIPFFLDCLEISGDWRDCLRFLVQSTDAEEPTLVIRLTQSAGYLHTIVDPSPEKIHGKKAVQRLTEYLDAVDEDSEAEKRLVRPPKMKWASKSMIKWWLSEESREKLLAKQDYAAVNERTKIVDRELMTKFKATCSARNSFETGGESWQQQGKTGPLPAWVNPQARGPLAVQIGGPLMPRCGPEPLRFLLNKLQLCFRRVANIGQEDTLAAHLERTHEGKTALHWLLESSKCVSPCQDMLTILLEAFHGSLFSDKPEPGNGADNAGVQRIVRFVFGDPTSSPRIPGLVATARTFGYAGGAKPTLECVCTFFRLHCGVQLDEVDTILNHSDPDKLCYDSAEQSLFGAEDTHLVRVRGDLDEVSEYSASVSADSDFAESAAALDSCASHDSVPAPGGQTPDRMALTPRRPVLRVHNAAGDTMDLTVDKAYYECDELALFDHDVPQLALKDVIEMCREKLTADREEQTRRRGSRGRSALPSREDGEALLRELPLPSEMLKLVVLEEPEADDDFGSTASGTDRHSILRFQTAEDGECTGVQLNVEALRKAVASRGETDDKTFSVCDQTVTCVMQYDVDLQSRVSDAQRLERLLQYLTPEYSPTWSTKAYVRRHGLATASAWGKFHFRFCNERYVRFPSHPDPDSLRARVLHELHHLQAPELIGADERLSCLCGALLTRLIVLQDEVMIRWLVRARAAPSFGSFDSMETCPVHQAACVPDDSLVYLEAVLAGCTAAEMEARDADGQTALHRAIQAGNTRCLESLIRAGASVESRSLDGRSPLFFAISCSRRGVLEALLRHQPDVTRYRDANTRDWNPLRGAIQASNAADVKLLLDAGADSNATYGVPAAGLTPLHDACARDYSDGRATESVLRVVDALLEGGADIEARDEQGRTPLHWAAMEGGRCEALVQSLLEAKANIDARDHGGRTALHWSLRRRGLPGFRQYSSPNLFPDASCTLLLTERGADASVRDELGDTALDFAKAKYKDHPQFVKDMEIAIAER